MSIYNPFEDGDTTTVAVTLNLNVEELGTNSTKGFINPLSGRHRAVGVVFVAKRCKALPAKYRVEMQRTLLNDEARMRHGHQ